MIEVSVKISNDESKLTKKFLSYDTDIVLHHEDPKLKAYVDQSLRDFEHTGKPDDIVVNLKMTW
jgi:hypothetical protein